MIPLLITYTILLGFFEVETFTKYGLTVLLWHYSVEKKVPWLIWEEWVSLALVAAVLALGASACDRYGLTCDVVCPVPLVEECEPVAVAPVENKGPSVAYYVTMHKIHPLTKYVKDVFSSLGAGLHEEFLFREVMLGYGMFYWSVYVGRNKRMFAFVLSLLISMLFASQHAMPYPIYFSTISMILCWVYLKYGLQYAVVIHVLFDVMVSDYSKLKDFV
jgi:hypothetical protein